MDQQIFLAVNGLVGHWRWLDQLGLFFADKAIYVLGLVILVLWVKKHVRRHVYLAIASAALSRLGIELLKRWIDRPRPYEHLSVHQLLADNEHGTSFPSGHAVIVFSFAFAFYGTKYFWPLFVAACLVSLARVFVGVHYPADIVVGGLIALITVYVMKKFFHRHFR